MSSFIPLDLRNQVSGITGLNRVLTVFVYSLEGLMLKLKLQYFGHLMQSRLIRKDPDTGKDWRQEEKGTSEDKILGWHHWLNGHEFEQAQEIVKDRGAWCAAVHGVTRVRHYWATEQQQQQLVVSLKHLLSSCKFTKKKKVSASKD